MALKYSCGVALGVGATSMSLFLAPRSSGAPVLSVWGARRIGIRGDLKAYLVSQRGDRVHPTATDPTRFGPELFLEFLLRPEEGTPKNV